HDTCAVRVRDTHVVESDYSAAAHVNRLARAPQLGVGEIKGAAGIDRDAAPSSRAVRRRGVVRAYEEYRRCCRRSLHPAIDNELAAISINPGREQVGI